MFNSVDMYTYIIFVKKLHTPLHIFMCTYLVEVLCFFLFCFFHLEGESF